MYALDDSLWYAQAAIPTLEAAFLRFNLEDPRLISKEASHDGFAQVPFLGDFLNCVMSFECSHIGAYLFAEGSWTNQKYAWV